jgi:hypothetical protein
MADSRNQLDNNGSSSSLVAQPQSSLSLMSSHMKIQKEMKLEYRVRKQTEHKITYFPDREDLENEKNEGEFEGVYLQVMPDDRIYTLHYNKATETMAHTTLDKDQKTPVFMREFDEQKDRFSRKYWYIPCKNDEELVLIRLHKERCKSTRLHIPFNHDQGIGCQYSNAPADVLLQSNPQKTAGFSRVNYIEITTVKERSISSAYINHPVGPFSGGNLKIARKEHRNRVPSEKDICTLIACSAKQLAFASQEHVELWNNTDDDKWECESANVFSSESKSIRYLVAMSQEQFAVVESNGVTIFNLNPLQQVVRYANHQLHLHLDYAPVALADRRTLLTFDESSLQLFNIVTGNTQQISFNFPIAHVSMRANGNVVILGKSGNLHEVELEYLSLTNCMTLIISESTALPQDLACLTAEYAPDTKLSTPVTVFFQNPSEQHSDNRDVRVGTAPHADNVASTSNQRP